MTNIDLNCPTGHPRTSIASGVWVCLHPQCRTLALGKQNKDIEYWSLDDLTMDQVFLLMSGKRRAMLLPARLKRKARSAEKEQLKDFIRAPILAETEENDG